MCSKARSGFGNTPCPNPKADEVKAYVQHAAHRRELSLPPHYPTLKKDQLLPVLFLFHLFNTLQRLNHIHPADYRSHDKVYDEGKAHGKQAGIEIGGGVDAPGEHHHIGFHRI